ncbi:MAG: hypothetical protein K6T34_06555 [Thermoflavifilum sp.]|nr:hypothetical protein [Thermoflavifilum sp.]
MSSILCCHGHVNMIRYYPKIVQEELYILFRSETFTYVQLQVKDFYQQIWSTRNLMLRPGINELVLYLGFLSPGVYWMEWDHPELPYIELVKA